jgi:hypothetical protein
MLKAPNEAHVTVCDTVQVSLLSRTPLLAQEAFFWISHAEGQIGSFRPLCDSVPRLRLYLPQWRTST